jgi:hypothetical protein
MIGIGYRLAMSGTASQRPVPDAWQTSSAMTSVHVVRSRPAAHCLMSGSARGWVDVSRVASCQDAREGCFVASRERARLVTGAGAPSAALLVARVTSWAVNA